MIVGECKPIEEIMATLSGYKNVLILGCGTCVTVCLSGGDKEANALARELSQAAEFGRDLPRFDVQTVERQCERDLVEAYLDIPKACDAILSMACGAGVQTLSGTYTRIPVIPALNTTFLGAMDRPGVWNEQCYGCGDCTLAYTGGICPLARCAKKLFNGPCGGSRGAKCEISDTVDCAWSLIIERLTDLNQINRFEEILPLRDWSKDRGGGPRYYRPKGRSMEKGNNSREIQ